MKPITFTSLLLASALPLAAQATRPTITLYDAASLTSACEQALAAARKRAETLAVLPMNEVSPDSVLATWNDQSRLAEDVIGSASLLAYVHPDKAVRDAGEACILKTTETQTAIFQNEALYKRVQAVSPKDAVDAQYRLDLIEAFEDTGVTLAPEPRAQAKAMMERLTALDQEFDRNLREVKTTLSFSPDE
ncbi:MAG: hypothetical protein ACRES4_03425, partial [Nevskiales bacterium]